MSVAIVAKVGAAAYGIYSTKRAGDKADAANNSSEEASSEAQEFEQARYDDFQETYGSIEDNLAGYYSSLNPEYYATRGVEAFEKEQTKAVEDLRASLAQRGILDSGIAAAVEKDNEFTLAEGRARIRADAPALAMEEQRSFLQVGMGNDPSSSVSQNLRDQANRADDRAASASAASAAAKGNVVKMVGTALDDYIAGQNDGGSN